VQSQLQIEWNERTHNKETATKSVKKRASSSGSKKPWVSERERLIKMVCHATPRVAGAADVDTNCSVKETQFITACDECDRRSSCHNFNDFPREK